MGEEDQNAREKIRQLFFAKGVFRTRVNSGKEEEGIKYRDYYDGEEAVSKAPSHRVLAMRRGEKEGFLILRVTPPEDEAIEILNGLFVRGEGLPSGEVKTAVRDCYKTVRIDGNRGEHTKND
jgi:uncharacterized protein